MTETQVNDVLREYAENLRELAEEAPAAYQPGLRKAADILEPLEAS